MATLKGETARGSDDAMQQYLEEINRVGEQSAARCKEAQARWEAEERGNVKDKLLAGTSVKG